MPILISLGGRRSFCIRVTLVVRFAGQHLQHLTNLFLTVNHSRPERFIDGNGSFKNNDMLNPFGIGRRKCLGESLARMENFLFLANILKNFKFSCAGSTPPSLEPDVGFTNGPFPFKTRITIR